MSKNRSEKLKLSKSILDMKFMKKSKEKAHQLEEDEEGRAMFSSEVTEAMRLGGSKFVMEPSYVPFENLIIGRLSYHGMNPELEKLLDRERGVVQKTGVKEEKDVSDSEMAERYSSLVGTVASRFNRKEGRCSGPPRKKARFLKPQDDD